jgi:chorismate-pyruvate lyase
MILPPVGTPGPDLRELLALFPATVDDLHDCRVIPAQQVPQPCWSLLDHEHHMTVTMEAHHGAPVEVQVLDRIHDRDYYARRIILNLRGSRRIVLYGLVLIDFRFCDGPVRAEIESEKVPLGRVLISHNVLRRIEPTAFLRVTPGPNLIRWFGLDGPRDCYGRLAYIHCNEQPAIELLEVITPETV